MKRQADASFRCSKAATFSRRWRAAWPLTSRSWLEFEACLILFSCQPNSCCRVLNGLAARLKLKSCTQTFWCFLKRDEYYGPNEHPDGALSILQNLNLQKPKQKPILLKIAPDLTDSQLLDIIDIINETQIAGVIATNTTLSRENLTSENKIETGGLSGKPLTKRSTEVIRFLSEKSGKAFPIVGVGGIHTAQDALEKLEAGASLVQLYTGFIYEGPELINAINREILRQKI